MNNRYKWLISGLTTVFLFTGISDCLAKNTTGMSYIENGNISSAKERAKKDAMRNFVEQEVGVNVKSQTEVANFLLIKDIVSTHSDGFVVVKKVISENVSGDIFTIVLDLEHGAKPFELAPNDIAAQLENLAENSCRNGLDVAIIDSNHHDTSAYNMFIMNRLNNAGFRVNVNDSALDFLKNNLHLDDLTINAGVRQAGRQERFDSMAIVRGRISVARQPEPVGAGVYRAVAEAACQIVSYDNNAADSVALYADDLGRTPEEAIKHAKEKALSDAVMELARSASKTIQRENRGNNGMGLTIKTVLIFEGVYDRANEPVLINKAIQTAGCRIVRSGFNTKGSYQVFVAYTAIGEENTNTLANNISETLKNNISSVLPPEESAGIGSVKYIIRLRG